MRAPSFFRLNFQSAVFLACLLLVAAPTIVAQADPIQFEQKTWDTLANHDVGEEGNLALSIRPAAWLHGETPDWIIHYRRITEAKRVALEIDFHLGFVAKTLGRATGSTLAQGQRLRL